jgi:hypothetical protein
MREPKKVERFRPVFSTSLAFFRRMAAELDQTCFFVMQFQAKLDETCAEFLQTRCRLALVLETYHEIIRITYHHDIAAAVTLPPPLDPKVKNIVQVHVRK